MDQRNGVSGSLLAFALLFLVAGGAPESGLAQKAPVASVAPAALPMVGTVDERYQSYNVEMVEVTGGRFWRPYDSVAEDASATSEPSGHDGTPTGMDPNLYEYRPPVDLSSPRLRMLARALGPAYMRVSGTWSNRTYVPAEGEEPPESPPAGYGSVLTPEQWENVVDFSEAVDAEIVTSFAIGAGVRDEEGTWTPIQAQRLLDLTQAHGGTIRATEFFNEPNLAMMGGAPEGYTAEDYGRDFQRFHAYVREAAPDMMIAGPGSVMETTGDWLPSGGQMPFLPTAQLLEASGDAGLDAFSYHHYGAVSQRCAGALQTSPEEALSEQWLRRTDETLAFYKPLRDQYAPGAPIWLTETAEAACGGNPWANLFLDTFRYLDQLGRLAKQEVDVVMHNTLVASDYSLIHEETLTPKPSYWGALLWKQLMGTTVLDSGTEIQEGLHLYAHCMPATPGGVTLLAINNSPTERSLVSVPAGGNRYTLAGDDLQATEVSLNGQPLQLGTDDTLPELVPAPFPAGDVTFEPVTITFLALPSTNNPACR
jgi:heparanase 1